MPKSEPNFFSRDVNPLSLSDQARMAAADEPAAVAVVTLKTSEPQQAQPKAVKKDSFFMRCVLFCAVIPEEGVDHEFAIKPIIQTPSKNP